MRRYTYREINPWTLKISSPIMSARYKKETNKYTLNQFRLALIIGAVFHLSFMVFDQIAYPGYGIKMVKVRLIYVIFVIIGILISTAFKFYSQHIVFFHTLTVFIAGGSMVIMNYVGRDYNDIGHGYMDVLLIYAMMYIFLEIPYLFLGLQGIALGVIYMVIDYYMIGGVSSETFIQTAFILLVSNIIGMGMAYNRERYAKETSLLKQQLSETVIKDSLTGLHNRRYFEKVCVPDIQLFIERIGSLKHIRRRMGDIQTAKYGLIMLDIDHFKRVNDSYGHRSGDLVLMQFAALLQESIRKSDDVIRMGGEEFLIVVKLTTENYLIQFMKKIGRLIQEYDFLIEEGQHICCTVSLGLVIVPDQREEDVTILMNYADRALYHSKDSGRNKGSRAYSLQEGLEFEEIKWPALNQAEALERG